MAADIGMPDFGLEFHDWGPERVIGGNFDIDIISATLVRSTRGPWKRATQVCYILLFIHRHSCNLGLGIGMDVGNFLANSAHSITRHDYLCSALRTDYVVLQTLDGRTNIGRNMDLRRLGARMVFEDLRRKPMGETKACEDPVSRDLVRLEY